MMAAANDERSVSDRPCLTIDPDVEEALRTWGKWCMWPDDSGYPSFTLGSAEIGYEGRQSRHWEPQEPRAVPPDILTAWRVESIVRTIHDNPTRADRLRRVLAAWYYQILAKAPSLLTTHAEQVIEIAAGIAHICPREIPAKRAAKVFEALLQEGREAVQTRWLAG
jgi:hypothetical protein